MVSAQPRSDPVLLTRPSGPVLAWLLAFALAAGLGVLGSVATADARDLTAAGEHQEDVRLFASVGAGRYRLRDLPASPGPAPLAAPAVAVVPEAGAGCAIAREPAATPTFRPTFLCRVSYWTTGPPTSPSFRPHFS